MLVDDVSISPDPVIRHFIRLGYDNIHGYLAGGFPAWYRAAQELERTATCTVQELHERLKIDTPFILDVRDIKNRKHVGYIRESHHVYAGELPLHLAEIPHDKPIFVYCDAGFKGSLAASVLAMHNFRDVTNVLGGMQAWKQAGFAIEK